VRWLKADGTTVLPAAATPVTVAVIDTGVDFSHPELAGANWVNPRPGKDGDLFGWNFIDDNADIRDLSGHGTIIAGIIAASADGRFGIAGINPWARIMALKAMEIDGTGGSIGLSEAIVYAVDHGARVINLSVGGPTLTKAEQDAIDYAAKRDVLVVVAAGNEGIDTAKFSPAGLKNVLAVAAVGPDLKRQAFSNWGATIGIAAPGVDILSLRARQTDLLQMTRREYTPGTAVVADQFYRVTGSSFAAPIVSGAASLLFSINPKLTAVQVKRMLLQSARDLEQIGTNQFSGYGLLDIAGALAADPEAYAEAAITGVSVVQAQGRTMVRVLGTATADKLAEAHLEIGAGESPAHWKKVLKPLSRPVVAGPLGDIPADAFAGADGWTLRVIVTDTKGLRREARFKLNLG
jgi:subtilisin family serine protease